MLDGESCSDSDECTGAGTTCTAGRCGTPECKTGAKQVVENGVPLPKVQVDCALFLRKKHTNALKKGVCFAKLVSTSENGTIVVGRAMGRKKRKPSALSDRRKGRFVDGVTHLELELNDLGKRLLAEAADGTITGEVQGGVKTGLKTRHFNNLISLRR